MFGRQLKTATLTVLGASLAGYSFSENNRAPLHSPHQTTAQGSSGNVSHTSITSLPGVIFIDAEELFLPLKVRERPVRSNSSEPGFLNIYIPGMARFEENSIEEARILAHELAASVYLIENHTLLNEASDSTDLLRELSTTALSITSPEFANIHEGQEVHNFIGFLLEALASTSQAQTQIRIFAHSAGAAIAKTAFVQLSERYPDQYQALCQRTEIVFFGSPIHTIGAEECQPNAVEYAFDRDPVSGQITALFEWAGNNIQPASAHAMRRITVQSAALHAFSGYAHNLPAFLVAEVQQRGIELDAKRAIEYLWELTLEGRYADQVLSKAFDEICSPNCRDLAQALTLKLGTTNGWLNERIGNFRLSRSQLRSLRDLLKQK